MQKLCSLLKLLLFIILLSVDCTLFHFQFINTTVVNFQWFGPLSLLNPLSYEFSCLSVHLFLEITLLFTDFLLEVTVQLLSDGVDFLKKTSLLSQNNQDIFRTFLWTNWKLLNFSKNRFQIFLKLYLMWTIKKYVKVIVLD